MPADEDPFAHFEVMHTASIVMEMFDERLLSHEVVEADPELKAAAQVAFDGLFQFYQLSARLMPS